VVGTRHLCKGLLHDSATIGTIPVVIVLRSIVPTSQIVVPGQTVLAPVLLMTCHGAYYTSISGVSTAIRPLCIAANGV
jgi:hypothetical protein